MKWLFMIFRLWALQRMLKKYERKASLRKEIMLEYKNEGNFDMAHFTLQNWKDDMQQIKKKSNIS